MSTNKTPNYYLHSWLPQDEFHVTEINENFTKLDQALKAEAQGAASARSTLNTTLSGQVSQLSTTLNGKVQMIMGSYTGLHASNDGTPQHINLGICPKAVLIGYERGFVNHLSHAYGGMATAACNMIGSVILDGTGFTVANNADKNLRLNLSDTAYCYVALY